MNRWFPHVHVGGSSDECVRDDEGGREGWYFQVCWFGFMAGLSFSSIYAERRFMAEITREREEREKSPTYAKAGGPPDDWQQLQVRDLATGELVNAVEVNTAEAWAIIRNADGSLPKGGRTFGRFAIERKPAETGS